MKVVVAPHDMSIGGSQLNAIDLAGAVRDLGHEVIVHGVPGPAVEHVDRLGLRFVPATDQRYRPAPQRCVGLVRLVADEAVDIVHAYEWPPCLDAYFGPHLRWGTPLLCTVLSMHVPVQLPRSVPLLMGTEALAERARQRGIRQVGVCEPPIDTVHDSVGRAPSGRAGASDDDRNGDRREAVRSQWGIGPHEQLVVTVSRLAIDLKLDALERLIDAVGALGAIRWVRLLVVGGGEAETVLRRRAADLNARAGRDVVSFTGERSDPRPFYEAADVVAGMGSSVLRAMSFSRPVVVQGAAGFAAVFDPSTAQWFLRNGFWGTGDGGDGSTLRRLLIDLLDDAERRTSLGEFGRSTVLERFDLRSAARRVEAAYHSVVERSDRIRPPVREVPAVAARALRSELSYHGLRHRGVAAPRRARSGLDNCGVVS